jgi:hypothetical protein
MPFLDTKLSGQFGSRCDSVRLRRFATDHGDLRQLTTICDGRDDLRRITTFCDTRATHPGCDRGKKHRERNIKGCFTGVLLFRSMLCIFIALERCTE